MNLKYHCISFAFFVCICWLFSGDYWSTLMDSFLMSLPTPPHNHPAPLPWEVLDRKDLGSKISVWKCLEDCLLWSAKKECKSRVEYPGDFLVRTPPEMVLWKVRQLWLSCLHCWFESSISLGEKSRLQANVMENRLSNFDTSWFTRKKKRKSFLSSADEG